MLFPPFFGKKRYFKVYSYIFVIEKSINLMVGVLFDGSEKYFTKYHLTVKSRALNNTGFDKHFCQAFDVPFKLVRI